MAKASSNDKMLKNLIESGQVKLRTCSLGAPFRQLADLLDATVIKNPPAISESMYQQMVRDARSFANRYYGVDLLKMCQEELSGDHDGEGQ